MRSLATQLVVGKAREGTPHGEVWWAAHMNDWCWSLFAATRYPIDTNDAVMVAHELSDADGKAYTENALVAVSRIRGEVVA